MRFYAPLSGRERGPHAKTLAWLVQPPGTYMSPPPLPPHLSDISCNGKTMDLFKRRVVSPNELFFAVFILMTPWKIP
jgi:hypothetical protein